MARALNVQDAYEIINLMAAEMTGQNTTLTAADTSSFVAVGETLLNMGVENCLGALSLVLGKTIIAVRPYAAKLNILNTIDSGVFASRLRKISYYSRKAVIDGGSNTQKKTNHRAGYDNGTNGGNSAPSMWEQAGQPIPVEMFFSGSSEWQYCITRYKDALQKAFKTPEDFAEFVTGFLTECANDIEQEKEAFNRLTLLNAIAGTYDMQSTESVIDLTTAFNTKFNTNYTRAQLLSTYFTEFLEFFVSVIKTVSDRMTNRSAKMHWAPSKVIDGEDYYLLRHTPKAKQKLVLYNPFWIDAEARVKPQVFNERYIDFGNFEGVDFWQNELNPSEIDITPAVPDKNDPTEQAIGNEVKLDYVLGFLFDADGVMVDYMLEDAIATPAEARKRYYNVWYTFRKNAINDFSENMVLFYMSSGE